MKECGERPSRALKTAPGQKDASGKIKKSDKLEAFPEMVISKFSFPWICIFPGSSQPCSALGLLAVVPAGWPHLAPSSQYCSVFLLHVLPRLVLMLPGL